MKRIPAVDDETDTRDALADCLEHMLGMLVDVAPAADGEAARERLEASPLDVVSPTRSCPARAARSASPGCAGSSPAWCACS